MSSTVLQEGCGHYRIRPRSNIAGKKYPLLSDCLFECNVYAKITCDTEEADVKCSLPFTYRGYEYNGCIKTEGEKHWCLIKDKGNSLLKANCSKTCPTDEILATKKLSSKEIKTKLKTTQSVASMIEKDGDCREDFNAHEMAKV